MHRQAFLLATAWLSLPLALSQSTTTPALSVESAAIQALSSGCGTKHINLGISLPHTVHSSNRTRSYLLHLPQSYDENKKTPVVFGFHGSPGIGVFFAADTKFSDSKFSGDKIMVYPDGEGGSWAGANYSKVSVKEDLQFVDDMVTSIRANYCVDDNRIYATGISIGGGFVNTIACDKQVGGKFAAFAPASGAYYTDANGPNDGCSPARVPMPILEIHGGSDHTVSYDGGQGEGGALPSIPKWLDSWATRGQCSNKTTEESFNNDVQHYTWTCAGEQGALQHYKIDDMDHCWASTEPNFSQLSVKQGPTHIEADDVIMKFFDQFSKP